MTDSTDVPRTLLEAPLPELIQRLGIAIADAQRALDDNSIQVALAMAKPTVTVDAASDKMLSLLELGFVPTFYAFTEATIEAKLTFSLQESTDIGGSVGVSGGCAIMGASLNASYARKFSFQAEGASSIATRLVSLPPPTGFLERLAALGK